MESAAAIIGRSEVSDVQRRTRRLSRPLSMLRSNSDFGFANSCPALVQGGYLGILGVVQSFNCRKPPKLRGFRAENRLNREAKAKKRRNIAVIHSVTFLRAWSNS